MSGERTFFEAQIDSSSIKVFTAALQLLHKVGKEVVFEVKPDLFALRALNDIKSSFALVEFSPSFFDSLIVEDGEFSCKLPAKVNPNFFPDIILYSWLQSLLSFTPALDNDHEKFENLTNFDNSSFSSRGRASYELSISPQ